MNIMRWLRTVRYLRPVQIYGRLWFRLYRPGPNLSPPPQQRSLSGNWLEPVSRTQSLLRRWTFRFLNEEHDLAEKVDWDNPAHEKLWRYNLHYFDDLNSTGASERSSWHKELLIRWIRENPPSRGTGWEPYPTSLRIVNWIKWSLAGNAMPEEGLDSLAVQTRWLMKRLEFHLLGNHLLSNAKALVFSGLFFAGDEAQKWLDEGFSILEHEISEQILKDGGHFERSPMYHALVLEDLLDICNILSTYANAVPQKWQEMIDSFSKIVGKMNHWLAVMSHPDGEISFFNDAAIGIAPNPVTLKKYIARLGIQVPDSAFGSEEFLEDSGYLRIERPDLVALLDVAAIGPDYLPGHAHADTLSFELSLFGQRVLVNSGTSCYGQNEERRRQRGTAAHNTVVVNGLDSSEVWAGFRVGRRANANLLSVDSRTDITDVRASHDGYSFLPGKVLHFREWSCTHRSLKITDILEGDYDKAVSRLHLHPFAQIDFQNEAQEAVVTIRNQEVIKMKITGSSSIKVKDSAWHYQFGRSMKNRLIEIEFDDHTMSVELSW